MKLSRKFVFFIGIGSLFLLSSNTAFAGSCTAGNNTYINAGSGATIGWNVSGGACTASVGGGTSGNISGWSGLKDAVGSAGVTSSGDANGTFSLTCDNGGDSATCNVIVCPTGQHAQSSSGPCVADVDASCSATHYNCTPGTSQNNQAISNGYTWDCMGSGPTGSNDLGCYECTGGSVWDGNSCEFIETYASCGGTAYTCNAGNYAGDGSLSEGGVGSNGTYSWTCNGYPNDASHRASCNLACGGALPTVDSAGWNPTSVTTGSNSTLYWTTSNASQCRWTRSKPGVGSPYYDSGYTGAWPFDNNTPGWTYGTVAPCDGTNSSCNGDTWTVQCKNSCNGYSAQSSSGALTVAPPDQPPIGTLDSVSSGNMLTCGVTGGWTFDPDASSSSIGVHFYIDGVAGVGTRFPVAGEVTTATSSADVNTAYGITGTHRFDGYRITGLTPGPHTLYAYGHGTVTQTADALLTPAGGIAFTCTNTPPVVNAGPDQTIANPTSTSSPVGASASDPDGSIASTVWSFVSGPGPVPIITNGNTLNPSFSNMTTDGDYVFRLTATDDQGTQSNDTMTVKRVTNGVCAPLHFSCTAGVSANNQTPASPAAGRDWTWNCNGINGGTNDSCSETGYWLMTSITQTGGSSGTITPGPGNILYASTTALTVTIAPNGYVIPPTGVSSALYRKGVDGATTTVNGTTPVPLTNNFTMSTDHYVAATLYVPDPITINISSTSTYLGDDAVLSWTTDATRCNIYNFDGSVLIKAIGAVSTSTANTATLTEADLPQTIGSFGYIMRCDDSGDINRGSLDQGFTVTLWCPRDPISYTGNPARPAAPTTCTNASPTPSIGHSSGGLLLGPTQVKVALGQPVVLSSVTGDTTSDLNALQLEWRHQESDGSWLWSWLPPSRGNVSYNNPDTFAETNTASILATFTPSALGTYYARFVARDDMANSPALNYIVSPNPRYYTPDNPAPVNPVTGRLTYSSEFKVDVVGVGAEFYPASGNSVGWRCYGSDYTSLVGTKAGNPDDVAVPYRRIIPHQDAGVPLTGPAFGTFVPKDGYFYTLTCETVDDQALAFYSSNAPILTENDVTATSADIAWDCNSPLAQGVTIEREVGMGPTSFSATTTSSWLDTGLAPNTYYTYTLRCYDGWSSGGVRGRLLGTAQLSVLTEDNFDPSPIVIDAYIRAKVADPTNSTLATTTDGAFYDWHYEVASGTPVSCTMQQRNDSGSWYPEPGYDTNSSAYTMRWSDIFQSDRSAFVNSYQTKHDWKIECVNALGTKTIKTWTLNRKQSSIPVIDSINSTTTPGIIAEVTLHCSPAATVYNITGPANQSGVGVSTVGGILWNPTLSGNYTITCDDGPPLVIFIDPTMWDPFFRLSGTQRSIGGTISTTLSWDISNPDPSCRLWAEVIIPPTGCDASCIAARIAASSTINAVLMGSSTDVNDPNGMRPMSEALTMPGYATTNARGKKTITGIRYGTVFVGQCAGSAPVRYRINISRENEG